MSRKGSPNIKGIGKLRYVVDQTFALLHHFQRLERWTADSPARASTDGVRLGQPVFPARALPVRALDW